MLTMSTARAEELRAEAAARYKALGFREVRPLSKKDGAEEETLLDHVKSNFAGMAGPNGGALGAASAAADAGRSSIERFFQVIGHYNWAMWELSPERLNDARSKLSTEDYEKHVQKWRDTAEGQGSVLQLMQRKMEEVWQVSGSIIEENEDGRLRIGDFSMQFSGDGYTARLDSNGLAEVSAGGGILITDRAYGTQPAVTKGNKPVQLDVSV